MVLKPFGAGKRRAVVWNRGRSARRSRHPTPNQVGTVPVSQGMGTGMGMFRGLESDSFYFELVGCRHDSPSNCSDSKPFNLPMPMPVP